MIILCVCVSSSLSHAQHLRLYLLPGTGADERLFHQLDLSEFDTVNVVLPLPQQGERMPDYADRIAASQIETSQPFALLGVSLGGMVAVELASTLSPEFTLIVASAKTYRELPPSYRLGRILPFHRVVGGRSMRWITRRAQPRMEPMAEEQRQLFFNMLYAKDPRFVHRVVDMMIRWRRTEAPAGITHIHGQLDRTLPYKYVNPTLAIRGEGHMLVYSKPEAVELILDMLSLR